MELMFKEEKCWDKSKTKIKKQQNELFFEDESEVI